MTQLQTAINYDNASSIIMNPDNPENQKLIPLSASAHDYLLNRGLLVSTFTKFNLHSAFLDNIQKIGWRHHDSPGVELLGITEDDLDPIKTIGSPETFSVVKMVTAPSEIIISENMLSAMSYAQLMNRFDVWYVVLNSPNGLNEFFSSFNRLFGSINFNKFILTLAHDDNGLATTDKLKDFFSHVCLNYTDHSPKEFGLSWSDIVMSGAEACTVQDTKRYISPVNIKQALCESLNTGKVVVISDFPGSGKTTASINFIVEHREDGVLFIAEKITTLKFIAQELINRGIPATEIGIYHHNSGKSLTNIYESFGTKNISLVTHRRLLIDPMHIWLKQSVVPEDTKFSSLSDDEKQSLLLKAVPFNPNKKWIIVDEQPSLTESVKLILPVFSELIKGSGLEQAVNDAINGDKLPVTEAKRLITNGNVSLYNKLSALLEQYQEDKDIAADDILRFFGIAEWGNSSQLGKKSDSVRFEIRIHFLIRKILAALLTGKYKSVTPDNRIIYSTLVTPLSDFNSGVAILDGTAIFGTQPILSLYGKDYFSIRKPSTRPSEATVRVKIINSPYAKNEVMRISETDTESLNLYKKYLNTLISARKRGNKILFVSYKNKKVAASSSRKKKSSNVVVSTETEVETNIMDQIEFITEVERILKEKGVKYKKLGTDNFILDSKEGYQTDKKTGVKNSNLNSEDGSDPEWYLTYYGLTKGSNSLVMCDMVILQSGYVYPKIVYETQKAFSGSIESYKIEQIANSAFQEILRSGLRVGRDIELIIGNDSGSEDLAPWVEKLLFLLRKYYVVKIDTDKSKEEIELKHYCSRAKIPYIFKKLDKNQKSLLQFLFGKYPALQSDSKVPRKYMAVVNTHELAKELDIRSDNMFNRIKTICKNSEGRLEYKIVSLSKSKSTNTIIKLWVTRKYNLF
jgi:hypothetical protein